MGTQGWSPAPVEKIDARTEITNQLLSDEGYAVAVPYRRRAPVLCRVINNLCGLELIL